MSVLHKAFAILLLANNHAAVRGVMVGDAVCTTGYIMDKFCIDRGTLLDNSTVVTLKNPEYHSFHCLLDVSWCINSGYIVLSDTKDDDGMHCLGYRLDDTQAVLDAGLAAGQKGYCTDCTGDETKPEYGYRATIKGTVMSLGDGSDGVEGTPVIGNMEVLDESVGCDVDTVEPVCMGDMYGVAPFEPVNDPEEDLEVGDEVCITNYIVDQFCIDQGFFIDAPDTVALEKPEEHSFHCLLDVPQCVASGYLVLTDKNEDTGMHCLGYRLDDTQAVLDAGFAAGRQGYCTGCTGDESKPEKGFRATVKGTVKEIGDGSDGPSGTPILSNIQVLDASEECEKTIVNPVCMDVDPPVVVEPPEVVEPEVDTLEVGDEVCWAGYIMDQYCINLGHFLDDSRVMTLEKPEEHSFHCLLDVDRCKDSGYVVLGEKVADTGLHCLGYRLDDTEAVLSAGLAAGQKGYCTDCTGGSDKPEYGYRATIKGKVKSLGDGKDGLSGTPILEDIEVLDESVGCEEVVIPPQCPGGIATNIDGAKKPEARDCTIQMCTEELADDYLLRYQINVPSETTVDVCDGCTISMELEYDGEAWVSIAFSNDGAMIGSEAVIANPGDVTVLKYNLGGKSVPQVTAMPDEQQTLTETSVEFTGGKTIAKFTKLMDEDGEITINVGDNNMLWAYGSGTTLGYHAARESKQVNLSSGDSAAVTTPNMSAWIAHGACAFIAWGVLVPFAVQSSLLRSLLPSGPLWFKLHRAFNASAFAIFVAAFGVAVAYTSKEGGNHFSNSHQRMGLAMFIMAFLQVVGGAARPHLPAPDSGEEKTPVRKSWEVGHRVLGVTLLACGFWQMQEGIKLYSLKYSVSDDGPVTIAYWVWIALMSALIVGGVFLKLRSSSEPEINRAHSAPLADEEVPVDN